MYSFNETPFNYPQVYQFKTDNSYVGYLGNGTYNLFTTGLTGEYINICGARSDVGKPNKLYYTMTTPLNNGGAGIKIKLPIFKQGGGYTYHNPEIRDAVIIRDETNGLTQSGFIEWEMPDDYANYGNLNAKSLWYSWQVIITSLGNTITAGRGTFAMYDWAVYLTNEGTESTPVTFKDIHNYLQTIDTSLSTRNVNQYTFNCGIHLSYSTYFQTKSEHINMGRNFDTYFTSQYLTMGEKSNGKGINGTSFKYNCYNADYGGYIAYINSKIYDLTYEAINEEGSSLFHGHWGAGIGGVAGQELNGIKLMQQRSVNMTPTGNVVIAPQLIGCHIEPIGSIIDGGIVIAYAQAMRSDSNNNRQYVHNFDFSAITTSAIQNRGSGRFTDIQNYSVDGKYNPNVPYSSFQIHTTNTYTDQQKTNIVYSLIVNVTTPAGIPIANTIVTIKDKFGVIVFTGTTSIDGYVTNLSGTVTEASTTYIKDSNNPFPVGSDLKYNKGVAYEELYMTTGNNKGVRKIIKPYNTNNTCYSHTDYETTLNIGDRFIKIPYITNVICTIDDPIPGRIKTGIQTEQGPFTLQINKGDYKYSEIIDITAPIKKTIVLEKKVKSLNTDLENLN